MSRLKRYKRSFLATTRSLKDIRAFFSEIAGRYSVHPDLLDQMVLAVDEAATNVIKHSLKSNEKQTFDIEVESGQTELIVRLIDHGLPFDPAKIPVPDIEESIHRKKRGGLGIYLMKQIMDDVRYSRENSTNITELIKYF